MRKSNKDQVKENISLTVDFINWLYNHKKCGAYEIDMPHICGQTLRLGQNKGLAGRAIIKKIKTVLNWEGQVPGVSQRAYLQERIPEAEGRRVYRSYELWPKEGISLDNMGKVISSYAKAKGLDYFAEIIEED